MCHFGFEHGQSGRGIQEADSPEILKKIDDTGVVKKQFLIK
jgi:hypothetical protein